VPLAIDPRWSEQQAVAAHVADGVAGALALGQRDLQRGADVAAKVALLDQRVLA
jgi:hypothetical protein